ncbi:hypothetical protein DYB31_009102, partial [Aphanomyces astaci]
MERRWRQQHVHAMQERVQLRPHGKLSPPLHHELDILGLVGLGHGFTSHRGVQRNSFVYGSGRAAALATVDPRSAESPMRRRDSRSIGSAKSFDEADPSWHHMDGGCSYKYTEMHLSKHSMDGYVFDFSKHNRSLTHVGLENSLPFAYMNAVLQLLFATPAVTSTLRTHLCDVVNCVCCELAFLCHMMDQTTKYALQKHKSVQTTNFLSALHQ